MQTRLQLLHEWTRHLQSLLRALLARLGNRDLMRLSVDARQRRQGMHVRVIDERTADVDHARVTIPAWALVPGRGRRWMRWLLDHDYPPTPLPLSSRSMDVSMDVLKLSGRQV